MIIRCGITGILMMFLVFGSMHLSIGQSDIGKIKCICIDAGHGGKDPGAIGSKAKEKNVVLAVALKLGKLIETTYPDIKVVYIRDKDVFVELRDRTRIANKNKADLFISIHANALDVKKKPGNKNIKGVETFVLGTNSSEHNLKVAMQENSVIHYEDDYSAKYAGFDPARVESYILFNMIRNLHLENSVNLATMIQSELVKNTKQVNREVRQAPLWVLKDVAMPAALVEIGYITNLDDERFMMSAVGQDKIARSIFKGFQNYKNKLEAKTMGSLKLQNKEAVSRNAGTTESRAVGDIKSASKRPLYAIQVASSAGRMKDCASICRGMKVNELYSKGRYRYYVKASDDLDVVKKSLGEVRKIVKDCFVIAIYNDEIISVAEARKLEGK